MSYCTCGSNEVFRDGSCQKCPANAVANSSSTQGGACKCEANHRVSNNLCEPCASGQSRLAGDVVPGPDTNCTAKCNTDVILNTFNVTNHTCGNGTLISGPSALSGRWVRCALPLRATALRGRVGSARLRSPSPSL
eukprot:Sspe_Gene.5756::Locus_1910_Transcript_1_1_Confidence_1.000_Length_3194::g.5756::m.5756